MTSINTALYIGWDVGGWNCERNPTSRDAIVILDANLEIVGTPWRGNLRECINKFSTSAEWLVALINLCGNDASADWGSVTLAIDTPLGFPDAFLQLTTQSKIAAPIESSSTNPYLFRCTERYLFERGLRPLSAVKDMIGSQATKGMHVVARLGLKVEEPGVWKDSGNFTVIETYPSACKSSKSMQSLLQRYAALNHPDCRDALTCALVGGLFAEKRSALLPPKTDVPQNEGWIWLPGDVFVQDSA